MVLMQQEWNQTDIALEHWPLVTHIKKGDCWLEKIIPNNSLTKENLKELQSNSVYVAEVHFTRNCRW